MNRLQTLTLASIFVALSCLRAAADEPANAPAPTSGTPPAVAASPEATNPPPPPAAAPSAATTHPPAPSAPPASENAANETQLPEISIYGHLDTARDQILPSLGDFLFNQ